MKTESKPRKYVYEFINKRKVTKKEFLKWFEKKFLYTIRKFKMINNHGDVIAYLPGDDFRSVALKHLLEMLEEKGRIELIMLKKGERPKGEFKLASSTTSDTVAVKIIAGVIKSDALKDFDLIAPVERHVINPLYLFLNKEVKLYADLIGLKYKDSRSSARNQFKDFVNEMEKKHPELKYSIVQSYLELNK